MSGSIILTSINQNSVVASSASNAENANKATTIIDADEPIAAASGVSEEDLSQLLTNDFSALKKKKRKAVKVVEDKVNADTSDADAATASPESVGGVELPTEDDSSDYSYADMLDRLFTNLRAKNPHLADGNKTNLHRQLDHVQAFFLAEMTTEGSIDGQRRFVIKGRFQPKQIEIVLKKYITKYVTCHMCHTPNTVLTRDSLTRLYFVQCESCNSRRSVAPIRSGFVATGRGERRVRRAQENA